MWSYLENVFKAINGGNKRRVVFTDCLFKGLSLKDPESILVGDGKTAILLQNGVVVVAPSKFLDEKQYINSATVDVMQNQSEPDAWIMEIGEAVIHVPIVNTTGKTYIDYNIFNNEVIFDKYPVPLIEQLVNVTRIVSPPISSLRNRHIRYAVNDEVTLIVRMETAVSDDSFKIPKMTGYKSYIKTESNPYAIRTHDFILCASDPDHLGDFHEQLQKIR